RGLGGDVALAAAIATSPLGDIFEHEAYWLLVIRWLIDNPSFPVQHVRVAITYLTRNRRLCPCVQRTRRSKHAAAEEFLRELKGWQAMPATSSHPATQSWKSSGIGAFEYRDERGTWKLTCWKIQELLDHRQLTEEGKALRHCVGSYSNKCARGKTTIWSLTRSD